MSDLTLEILNNKEKYPDTAEITLADGQKITVKEFRDSLQPRAEFTRASEGWKRREQELTASVEGLNQQLAQAMKDKEAAAALAGAPPARPDTISEEDLIKDPILGPLVSKLKTATERLEAHEARLKGHEEYVLRREYTGQLAALGSRFNTRFNADGKGKAFDQKAFLDYAIQHQLTDLEVAFNAWTRDDEIALTTKEAEARGIEKGKATKVPVVPFGRRRSPTKPEGVPSSLQEVTDEMLEQDPEMQEALRGEEPAG